MPSLGGKPHAALRPADSMPPKSHLQLVNPRVPPPLPDRATGVLSIFTMHGEPVHGIRSVARPARASLPPLSPLPPPASPAVSLSLSGDWSLSA